MVTLYGNGFQPLAVALASSKTNWITFSRGGEWITVFKIFSQLILKQREPWLMLVITNNWAIIFIILFSFLRKISPELTTASPPLSAEEAWPWANIAPIFLYFIRGTPTTAWRAKRCHVRTRDPNRRTLGRWSGTCALNCCATGPAPHHWCFLMTGSGVDLHGPVHSLQPSFCCDRLFLVGPSFPRSTGEL